MVVMARYLEPDQFSAYGVLTVSIAYTLYIVSFEFHNYTTRELIAHSHDQWGRIIKSQLFFMAFLYSLVTLALFYLDRSKLLPAIHLAWFVGLLILEHIFQESTKILIANNSPTKANLVIFLGHGLWPICAAASMIISPDARNISFVLYTWTFGAASSSCLGIFFIMKERLGGWKTPVKWAFIRKGIIIAFPLLLSTLAIRGMLTFDRYLVDHLSGKETLSAYILFTGLAAAMLSLLEACLFYPVYPKLIEYAQKNQTEKHTKTVKEFFFNSLAFVMIFSSILLLTSRFWIDWLERNYYAENIVIFKWILIAFGAYCLSTVPHYALYSMNEDRKILGCNIASSVVFIISISAGIIYLERPEISLIPLSLCGSFLSLFLLKGISYLRLRPLASLSAA